jgi:hypothetical protein
MPEVVAPDIYRARWFKQTNHKTSAHVNPFRHKLSCWVETLCFHDGATLDLSLSRIGFILIATISSLLSDLGHKVVMRSVSISIRSIQSIICMDRNEECSHNTRLSKMKRETRTKSFYNVDEPNHGSYRSRRVILKDFSRTLKVMQQEM